MRLENYPPVIDRNSQGWYVCMDPQRYGGSSNYYLQSDGVVRRYTYGDDDYRTYYTTKGEAQRTLDEYTADNTFSEVV